MIRIIGCLVALYAVFGSATVFATDRALLIGIDDYSDSRLETSDGVGRVGNLNGAVNDVKAMQELLEKGFGVAQSDMLVITNRKATHSAVLKAIDEWLIRGTQPGDRVFFHYSGHGAQVKDLDGDETGSGKDGLDEILVMADINCRYSGSLGSCENHLLDDELSTKLDQLNDRHVLVFIDSCNSGTATRSLVPIPLTNTRLLHLAGESELPAREAQTRSALNQQSKAHTEEGGFVSSTSQRIAMSAVGPHQLALEINGPDNKRVGLFTSNLVRGVLDRLADHDKDGEISFAELDSYVKSASEIYCSASQNQGACNPRGVTPQAEVPVDLYGLAISKFGKVDSPTSEEAVSSQQISAVLPERNSAQLSVRLLPDENFKNNELLQLEISSQSGGMLLVLDRNADGQLTQLYPNPKVREDKNRPDGRPIGWVRPGSQVLIPDTYYEEQWPMGEPFGEGHIIAILAEDYRKMTDFIPDTRAFEVTPSPQHWLGELYTRLESLVVDSEDPTLTQPSRWSITTASYRIAP